MSFTSFLGLHSWRNQFVGLSKRGVLYVFTSLYDGPDEAMIRIDLRSIDARVAGNANQNLIKVSNGDAKVYLKFTTMEEFSSWLRQLSDFGVTAASRGINNNQTAKTSATANQTQRQHEADDSSQRDAGQTDDFSSTFGM